MIFTEKCRTAKHHGEFGPFDTGLRILSVSCVVLYLAFVALAATAARNTEAGSTEQYLGLKPRKVLMRMLHYVTHSVYEGSY